MFSIQYDSFRLASTKKIAILISAILLISCANSDSNKRLDTTQKFIKYSTPEQYGLDKLRKSLSQSTSEIKNISITSRINESLTEQSFHARLEDQQLIVEGGDVRGLMYGLLELAEKVQLGQLSTGLNIKQKPHFKKRGLKFNVPLDARAPSYDDTGDSAQKNIETVWDINFWRTYLDRMADNRYNQLTLWNPQPFTSMTRLEKYPGLALDNVYITRAPLSNKVGSWGEAGGVNDVVLNQLKKVKNISIDEKITFWRQVMAYAKSRGIDVHIITWSIYTNGIQGRYGMSDDIDNINTQAFFREAVKELILTYPDLKGIGVTAGERMPTDGRVENWSREKWLWQTYGLGLQDAKKIQPSRSVDFIHRFWYSGYEDIKKYWGDYPDHFSFSFKYIMARLYSSPAPSHIAEKVLPMLKENPGVKTWWNLRNDDIFVYRWGDPSYAKEFYSNIPMSVTEGIHMGSDGYVWAKTFADKTIDDSNTLEIDKHWYRFMIWGRLAYNPNLDRSFFASQLKLRFPGTDENILYDAWWAASQIVPIVNQFQFQAGDRRFSPESCSSRETFRYVNDFQVSNTIPKSNLVNARRFVQMSLNGDSLRGIQTPYDTANLLEKAASTALTKASQLRLGFTNPSYELLASVADIEAFSYLGQYYAEKIRAATALEFFEKGGLENKYKKPALSAIQKAQIHWQNYRQISEKFYSPQMLARVGEMDWQKLAEEVAYEVKIVKQKIKQPRVVPETNDPEHQLKISYTLGLKGELRHESLKVATPDSGEFMVEVYEQDGTFINNYHSYGSGPMRWEWLQSRKNGTYYLNLKWKNYNRVIAVSF